VLSSTATLLLSGVPHSIHFTAAEKLPSMACSVSDRLARHAVLRDDTPRWRDNTQRELMDPNSSPHFAVIISLSARHPVTGGCGPTQDRVAAFR
jgi:hypothetical protein